MRAGGSVSRRLGRVAPSSYRADPAVPAFPDDKALVVFDGVCVLCSKFAQFLLRRDTLRAFRFTTAQSPLGQALFRHYGLDASEFETNLLIVDGHVYGKLDSVAHAGRMLGSPWSALMALRLIPSAPAEWLYDCVARNRYRLFGRRETCMIPPPEWRERFIG